MTSRLRWFLVLTTLMVAGVASAAYVLVQQRAPIPFQDTYTLDIELSAADGVAPGLGQPVLVAGVKVGSITDLDIRDGRATVGVTIKRGTLPSVHEGATASLEPITPLKDMQLNLDPGPVGAPKLRDGAVLDIGSTEVPVPLADLTSTLDSDTRAFLGSLIAAVGEGTRGRADGMQAALRTLGPTTHAVRSVSAALADRRKQLARLVTNVSRLTAAASRDDRLDDLVVGSAATLNAVAVEERALRGTLERLPSTLDQTRRTLSSTAAFAQRVPLTVDALLPAVRRLPSTLDSLGGFSRTGTRSFSRDLIPFVDRAVPVVRNLRPAVAALRRATPDLVRALQVAEYMTNVAAYNPEGDDEGYLFWLSWFIHNFNSTFDTSDAHGGFGRASVIVSCKNITGTPVVDQFLQLAIGAAGACDDGQGGGR
ncbi:MlaD family protein [Paraconexibacter algicola]|uniref:Mce/MlaD domain-containing protein n=1 Tax=Paraconexibacter algicola TaxID=2133960 RepID=A0A2T4UL71_9ACTN|nr:MlaD family protein [Paraconexibacter algicola]PTL59948.1 hypothetical protein C7Y72_09975 [Paraconexibacter algicola]